MKQAIGLIEVQGLTSGITVADTMLKVAAVELIGIEKAKGFGWMTVEVTGDVAAVQAAVDAGKGKALDMGNFISSLVIPRPATHLNDVFFNGEKQQAISSSKITLENETVVPVVPIDEVPLAISDTKAENNDEKNPEEVVLEPTETTLKVKEKKVKSQKKGTKATKKKQGGNKNE